jgi:hypothetical protein
VAFVVAVEVVEVVVAVKEVKGVVKEGLLLKRYKTKPLR